MIQNPVRGAERYCACLLRVGLLVLLAASPLFGESPAFADEEPTRVCMVPFWGGVLPGGTSVEQAERLFLVDGPWGESHDERTLALRNADDSIRVLLTAFDGHVWSVELRRGGADSPREWPVSSAIPASTRFGVHQDLQLGATQAAVRKNMGEPSRVFEDKEGQTCWIYLSHLACDAYDLESGFRFDFRDGVLVAVVFWEDYS